MRTKIELVLNDILPAWLNVTMESFNVHLDYSPLSLLLLENALNERYPEADREWPNQVSFMFGIYLGQVMVKHIPGAKWDEAEIESPFDALIRVEGENGLTPQVYPCRRARNFCVDRTDGLFAYFEGIRVMTTWTISEIYNNAGKWHHSNGIKFRSLALPKEVTDEQLAGMGFNERYIKQFRKDLIKS